MLNQSEMIDTVHKKLSGRVTKNDVRKVLAEVAANVTRAVAKGQDCVVPGVGRVKLSSRKARSGTIGIGRAAGTKYKTKAKMVPKMVFAKPVRDAAAKNKVAKSTSATA